MLGLPPKGFKLWVRFDGDVARRGDKLCTGIVEVPILACMGTWIGLWWYSRIPTCESKITWARARHAFQLLRRSRVRGE